MPTPPARGVEPHAADSPEENAADLVASYSTFSILTSCSTHTTRIKSVAVEAALSSDYGDIDDGDIVARGRGDTSVQESSVRIDGELALRGESVDNQSTSEPKEVRATTYAGCGILSPMLCACFEGGPQETVVVEEEPSVLASEWGSANTTTAANVNGCPAGGGRPLAAERLRALTRVTMRHAALESEMAELELQRLDWEILRVEDQINGMLASRSTEEEELSSDDCSGGYENDIGGGGGGYL